MTCIKTPLFIDREILHFTNGEFYNGVQLPVTGIVPSHSRPRVSNDNPFSEALFKTLKYWPRWPRKGFATIEIARKWVEQFINWYSHEHRHSGIQFVTPAQRHLGQDKDLLVRRHAVYQMARNAHPERWSGQTRNWKWIDQVHLNPDRDMLIQIDEERLAA